MTMLTQSQHPCDFVIQFDSIAPIYTNYLYMEHKKRKQTGKGLTDVPPNK